QRAHRVKLILEAIAANDANQLRQLARTDDGLVYEWLRREAWYVIFHHLWVDLSTLFEMKTPVQCTNQPIPTHRPILLHTLDGVYLREKGSGMSDPQHPLFTFSPLHTIPLTHLNHLEQDLRDPKQINKDVERSLYYFPQGNVASPPPRASSNRHSTLLWIDSNPPPTITSGISPLLKSHRQRELHDMIVEILWRNPRLNYYQGFHDVCTCFLLVLGKREAIPAAENVALTGVMPFYTLSWVLTWFSHDLTDFDKVMRLFDLFMASTPLMPVYAAC
ncbi:hypothetical protein BC936DRAFT_137129, partial [Jimgerdemannia flammicorona]